MLLPEVMCSLDCKYSVLLYLPPFPTQLKIVTFLRWPVHENHCCKALANVLLCQKLTARVELQSNEKPCFPSENCLK